MDRKKKIFEWLVNTDKEEAMNQLLEYAHKCEKDILELTKENEHLQGLFCEIGQLNLDDVTPSEIIKILQKSKIMEK